jgi:hypothetical protein
VLIALRARGRVLLATLAVSVVVVTVGVSLGGASALLSAITEQTGRGLQVEAPVSTVWLWAAAAGQWAARVYYDQGILTWQVFGDGTTVVAAAMTPLLALIVVAIAALGLIATRRGVHEAQLFPLLALALTMALVTVNKVGSPQFATWIAVPVMLGLAWQAWGGVSFRVPAVLALVIASLTQVIYPVLYGSLLSLNPLMLTVLSTRNLLYVALLGWAIWRLVIVCSRPVSVVPVVAPLVSPVAQEGASS